MRKNRCAVFILISSFIPFLYQSTLGAAEMEPFLEMITKDRAPVRRAPNVDTGVVAKINADKKISVRRHSRGSDCPEGWYQRPDYGYICGKHLRKPKEEETALSFEDDPNLRAGLSAAIVTQRKAVVYRKSKRSGRLKQIDKLLKGSILSGTPDVIIDQHPYFVTRQGAYVSMDVLESLPPPIDSLAITVSSENPVPAAVVKKEPADVLSAPSDTAVRGAPLDPWSPVQGPIEKTGTFFRLQDGSFVRASQISLVRTPPFPKESTPEERWIAVDLDEQLLYAYEGHQLVRLIPCSTGIDGNTPRGRFTIQKKVRQQAMRLRMGQLRVEDVQWVMFYDKDEAIAIHSAYWHRGFGQPKSHGCVNVPSEDARWLFEWSNPKTSMSDSVTLPVPRNSGTKVIVF